MDSKIVTVCMQVNQTCRACSGSFLIEELDLEFYRTISPRFADSVVSIPPPTLCPSCRQQRRLSWRNEFCYYRRNCDLCSKNVVSVHSTDKPYPVYCHNCWWSDKWEPISYGANYRSGVSFFEQFADLQSRVPQLAMMNDNGVASENCEYCQDFAFGKNCYLVTGSWKLRDSMYCTNCNNGRDLVDCDSLNLDCELCYQCTDSQRLYGCKFVYFSSGCNNCLLGFDLRECRDCLCCFGLRQKQFCVFNEQLTEQEYRQRVANLRLSSFEGLQLSFDEFLSFVRRFPQRAVYQTNCEKCLGSGLHNCRDTIGFDLVNADRCRYYYKGDSPQHCYDVHQSGNPQWCYESVTPDDSYLAAFSTWCWKGKHILYSDNCHSSEHLFGCISMRRAGYCILNKQYSKQEYEGMAALIANEMIASGEWGEFFPMQTSPFMYNETVANEYFPLERRVAVELGLRWSEQPDRERSNSGVFVPSDIADVPDKLVSELLSCANCNRGYKINVKELSFYKEMKVPVPRECADCRRKKRWAMRHPHRLCQRECHGCGRICSSVLVPSRFEQVYCEVCYLKLVQ